MTIIMREDGGAVTTSASKRFIHSTSTGSRLDVMFMGPGATVCVRDSNGATCGVLLPLDDMRVLRDWLTSQLGTFGED